MIEDTDDEAEYVYDNSNANDDNTINNENVYKEETTSHLTSVDTKVELNNDRIKSAINNYYSVVSERRYNEFETVFAPKLDRFFSLHNIDINQVIIDAKKQDKRFKQNKTINVRWNTLDVSQLDNGNTAVNYILDYTLEKENSDKLQKYVLKIHLELDSNYKITSIWEEKI